VRNNFGAIIPCDNYNKEVNKEVTFVDWYKNDIVLNVLFTCVFYLCNIFIKKIIYFIQFFHLTIGSKLNFDSKWTLNFKMLSYNIYLFIFVFKIVKGCHQDFSLLCTMIFVIYHFVKNEKWFTFTLFSPIYVFGFEIPFKIANSSIIHNMFSIVVRYDPSWTLLFIIITNILIEIKLI
jgi:hypothetical protein